MQVRKDRKWYKVLKRFGDRILVEKPGTILRESTKSWQKMSDFEEVK